VGKTNRRGKVLAVLDLFSDSRLLWTPDELRLELGYTRPTLYRYLKCLKDCDCI
jgi:DNA-binding IclR family transcriptional regulator